MPSATPTLDRFGRDLTALARKGELGPIIGRRREILAVLQALARSSKNNPVLVGEAGVGKTAIVEAIAMRAAEGKDPAVLGGKRIVELSVGALLGGTEYRGAFEERVQGVIAEARAHPEVIVFIDELHALVGAGRVGQGGLDAANLLKPPLARGELRCIGATTIEEYRRFVESDPALERRFEKVLVEEPDRDETLEILRGLRPGLERHHGVSLPDETLAAAVDLSVRFEPDRKLPDKAIDLVDKAAARTRLPMLSLLRPTGAREGGVAPEAPPVTPVIVARVLAEKRRLPLDIVTETLDTGIGSRLLALEGFLRERVLGQEEAIARVSRRLRLAFASPQGRRGPMAVLLFLGPSGVGKTETARLLAEHLFGSASGMIRIDMSELMEEHSVSKLIGSPPGYVGHEDEGQLTGAIRTKPHALLLLDEVEKAHPRVLDLFLQLFDEGRLDRLEGPARRRAAPRRGHDLEPRHRGAPRARVRRPGPERLLVGRARPARGVPPRAREPHRRDRDLPRPRRRRRRDDRRAGARRADLGGGAAPRRARAGDARGGPLRRAAGRARRARRARGPAHGRAARPRPPERARPHRQADPPHRLGRRLRRGRDLPAAGRLVRPPGVGRPRRSLLGSAVPVARTGPRRPSA